MPRASRALGPAGARWTLTDRNNRAGSCWPTAEEELLLTAALRPRAEALAAWERWQTLVDVQTADARTHTLLPLVYRRLRALGVPEASLGPLRSVYRREWYLNQVTLDAAARLLHAFEEAGIKTLVMKGAPLIVRYYRDVGVRPMRDLDILVPAAQARAAIRLLLARGWVSKRPSPESYLPVRHALSFTAPDGREVDVHWHALWECWFPGADDGLWEGAVPITLGDAETLTLGTADQLLHACAHGVAWNDVSPVRWVTDALAILDDGLTTEDWRRLVRHAEALGMTLPVLAGLRYLRDRWGAAIPQTAVDALQRAPVPRVQRLVYEARIRPPRRVLGYAPLVAYRYFMPDHGLRWSDLWGFPRYFQQYIGLEHAGQLPGFAMVWVGQRLLQRVRGRARVTAARVLGG